MTAAMPRRTITELRKVQGWTQQDLANKLETSRHTVRRLENREIGASPELLKRICDVLGCYPEDLDLIPPRSPGRPAHPDRPQLARFRETPPRMPRADTDWTSEMRLNGLRRDLPNWLSKLAWDPCWDPFLAEVPSESRDETIFHLSELHRGARPVEVSTDWLCFRQWPVIDADGRGGGCYRRPALVTADWLLVFQVLVLTPRRYRLDGLLLVTKPRRTFLDLEIDGKGHDPEFDLARQVDLAMPTVRLPWFELMKGPSLTERLRALGYCLPR